jgi:hypothetical protein
VPLPCIAQVGVQKHRVVARAHANGVSTLCHAPWHNMSGQNDLTNNAFGKLRVEHTRWHNPRECASARWDFVLWDFGSISARFRIVAGLISGCLGAAVQRRHRGAPKSDRKRPEITPISTRNPTVQNPMAHDARSRNPRVEPKWADDPASESSDELAS